MKDSTWGWQSVRSTVRSEPRLVTVARIRMSRCSRPLLGAIQHGLDAAERALHTVLGEQGLQPSLAHPGRADHGGQVAAEIAGVAHVGDDHLEHVLAYDTRVVEAQRRNAKALLPDLGGPGVVGAVGGSADVGLVGAVD